MSKMYEAGWFVRGEYITDDLVAFGGRGNDLAFLSPDPSRHIDRLPLGNPGKMADLYALTVEDIIDYLVELGDRLHVASNPHLQVSRTLSYRTAPTTQPIVDHFYDALPLVFRRETLREIVDGPVGIDFLEGWVEDTLADGRRLAIRAFGARSLHIVAGNSPLLSAITIVRNALIRGDAIIKTPSNDPFTALAIARTMAEMAPDHPITRHLSVAYWKGGDADIEKRLYQPANIEKIVAWGGFASIKHVTRYIQPGLELVSLDPKRSASIIGEEAFASPKSLEEAALRLATDIGAMNQEGCVNARVVYVLCGDDEEGLANLRQLAKLTYARLLDLPERTSTRPKTGFSAELRAHLEAARLADDWFEVIGGEHGEGGLVLSLLPEPVEFAHLLSGRVANLVPVSRVEEVLRRVDSYTQTVGIYPDGLIAQLRDPLAIAGAQRIVSLGFAAHGSFAMPQDGIEPLRRMCKWITTDICDPVRMQPLWT